VIKTENLRHINVVDSYFTKLIFNVCITFIRRILLYFPAVGIMIENGESRDKRTLMTDVDSIFGKCILLFSIIVHDVDVVCWKYVMLAVDYGPATEMKLATEARDAEQSSTAFE